MISRHVVIIAFEFSHSPDISLKCNSIPKIGLKNKSKRLIVHIVENVSSYNFYIQKQKGA